MVGGCDMFDLKIIRHCDIDKESLGDIIRLKEQHWPHGICSQERWLQENLRPKDYHFLLYRLDENGYRLVGYLNLVNINAKFKEHELRCLGVGNVCIDKRYMSQGLGKYLISKVNIYIEKTNMTAILLCREQIVKFYRRCGWNKLNDILLFIGETFNNSIIMGYNITVGDLHNCRLFVDRNF